MNETLFAEALAAVRAGSLSSPFEPGSPILKILEAEWPVETPGKLYEALLQHGAHGDRLRKGAGSYFTPSALVDVLLDEVMDPILPGTAEGLLNFRICDPACGTGHFLIPAARRLAARLSSVEGIQENDALALVIPSCIFGVDCDEIAVDLCRRALEALAGGTDLSQNLRCADSLSGAPFAQAPDRMGADAWCSRFAPGRSDHFHWSLEFSRGFDLVLGNPPFVNAIERKQKDPLHELRRAAFPELGGTADRSFQFLALASRIVKPDGWIAMVMPRSVLNAPAADGLRRGLNLRFLSLPADPDLFSGAAVFVCLVGIGPPGRCRLDGGDTIDVRESNWWRAVHGATSSSREGDRLADRFEVSASMTAGDAYDCRPYLLDEEKGDDPKFLTTGIIEPGESLWGLQACRHLGRRLRHPRLSRAAGTRSLQRRIQRAKRPKIIVAGLSKRIECVLDPSGECIGAVSTYSIFHPMDDVRELERLMEMLLSPGATELFTAELGANAMGGGSITMKKVFLENFPLRAFRAGP